MEEKIGQNSCSFQAAKKTNADHQNKWPSFSAESDGKKKEINRKMPSFSLLLNGWGISSRSSFSWQTVGDSCQKERVGVPVTAHTSQLESRDLCKMNEAHQAYTSGKPGRGREKFWYGAKKTLAEFAFLTVLGQAEG